MKKRLTETDEWLESMGYYRKHVAHDETCLFRSISEQIFNTQLRHEEIRRKCVKYAQENPHLFKDLVDNLDEYLMKLKNHMVVCGNIEIQIFSRRYRYNVILFNGIKFKCTDVTNSCYSRYIILCLVIDDHYDTLYKKEVIENAGFCQSIVYNILYENVYKMKNIETIVNTMLYNKPNDQVLKYVENQNLMEPFINDNSSDDSANGVVEKGPILTPFPFKVAKALDPNLYRNIEFDTWSEFRKEWRLSYWYSGDKNFKVGTRCILKMYDDNFETCHCYIQKLSAKDNKERCLVYIEELAEYRDVEYDQLQPMPNAKPWTLPYRYVKNIENKKADEESLTSVIKKGGKNKRLRNKRKKSVQENNIYNKNAISFNTEIDANNNTANFIGFPLNMSTIEIEEDFVDPGSPPGLVNREMTMQRWSAFHQDNQLFPQVPPQVPVIYVPHKSLEPNGLDLPEDITSLRYFYNLGIEYFCSSYAWSGIKPLYSSIQECSMGHTISSQYNMCTDPNNNLMYFSKQITKETSFGLSQANPPNFYQDSDYIKMNNPSVSVSFGFPVINPPSYVQCTPPPPLPINVYQAPPYPPIMSPQPMIGEANRPPMFGFLPPGRCDIHPYN